MSEAKKYIVSGIDEGGDFHIFMTGGIEWAAGMKKVFDEDLQIVTLTGALD